MSKTISTISLFIFWAVVTAILTASLIYIQNNPSKSNSLLSSNASSTINSMITTQVNEAIKSGKVFILDLNEIKKHNFSGDCWLLIDNKVYDVTTSISLHPGGSSPIISYCGKEATNAFNTKDINKPHSINANDSLLQYYIGNLNQSFGVTTTPPKPIIEKAKPTTQTSINNGTIPQVQTPIQNQSNTTILNKDEVAKHNIKSDCWLIINNKIYSVASYLSAHPGGVSTITPYCGKDGTTAFDNKGSSGHSSFANNLLGQYYIGDVNQTVTTEQVQQSVSNTNTINPPAQGDDEDEDEDEDDD